MAKRLILSFIFLFALLFSACPAKAQTFGLDATAQKAQYGTNTDIYSTISTIISLVLSVAGLVFLGIMFYAGLRWMSARGNDEYVTKAKDAMYAGILGFVIVSLSYGISAFIFSRLTK